MLLKRPSLERGHFNHGWLDTYHSFSFGDYYDPAHMGFRDLRVINEDIIAPAKGFGTHPHRDMEIITYVTRGALEHKDSMGTGSVIYPGDVQRMSAGTGVTHSEFNHSKNESTHLLQIWILPSARQLEPSYEQKKFDEAQKKNRFCLIASSDGREGSVLIHQDAAVYAAILEVGQRCEFRMKHDRHAWIQVVSGSFSVNGHELSQGDGAAISQESLLEFEAKKTAEVLLFDMI